MCFGVEVFTYHTKWLFNVEIVKVVGTCIFIYVQSLNLMLSHMYGILSKNVNDLSLHNSEKNIARSMLFYN